MNRPPRTCENVEALSEHDADLWVLDLDAIDPTLLDRYLALMSDDERDQERRLRFPGGRERHRCTRALVRTVLSHYTGQDPRAWAFKTNEYGKPDIAGPAGVALQFNLSHSGKLILCAVTRDAEVGVDVERSRELRKAVELARRFFAPPEAAVVQSALPEQQSREFLRFWTFKESYVKARGVGLLVPLEGFFFTLPADAPPSIGFADPQSDDSNGWQLAELCYADSYQMALAVRRPRTEPMNIRVRRTVPLFRTTDPQLLSDTLLRRWQIET
jgi:4'-phosphopantetheinyl transferase